MKIHQKIPEEAIFIHPQDAPFTAPAVHNFRSYLLIGSLYPKRPGVRKLVSRPYIIYYRYRQEENCVDVLRYWHGARTEPEF